MIRAAAALVLLLALTGFLLHYSGGGAIGPPPLPRVIAINITNQTYPNGSSSGTAIGTLSDTMSFGSFTGANTLQNGGFDSGGRPCDATNTTNFQIVGNFSLELNTTLSGSFNVCVVGTQGTSSLSQQFVITGTGGTQSFSSVPLSNNTFAPSSPSGTVVGVIGAPILSPSSPAFTGSCCTLSGTDAASFQVVGNNLETNGSLCTSPPVTYHINLVATQAGVTGSPFSQAETITCASMAVAGIALQSTTFTASVASIPVGAIMPTLTNGAPFTSAPFTGSLSIVTSGLDSNGTTCTTNGNHFQILSSSMQLAAASSSPPAAGSYPGVCVQASQAGYTSWTQAFTLTGAAAPANQIVLTNVSGSNISNYKYQFGRPFVDGVITSGNCPIVNINGSPAAQSQFDVKNSWTDSSVKFGVGAVVIPSLVNNVPTTLTFTSGACNNTALTQSQMLAAGFNFDGKETLTFPAAVLTGGATRLTTIANWQAVTNGGFDITINGTPLAITGLNFSTVTSQSAVANIVQAAINTALGTPNAALVWDLGGTTNLNEIFVLSVLGSSTSISAATAPGTGTDISGMLKWTSGTLISNITPSTATVSARTMLTNGNYTLWTSGPVAQTIILADDSAGRAYDQGDGDGHHPMRPRIYATFWGGDNTVSLRFAGEQNLTTDLEDMSYGVTITTGNTSPVTQTQLDLSGTGNAFGEGQTGLTAAQAKTATSSGIPNGNLTVSGTLSGPALTVGNSYYFEDLNIALWCQFKYVNSTTLNIIDGCNQNFGNSTPTNISIGDVLLVGNPKFAWTLSSWILPVGDSGLPSGGYWINDTNKSPQVNVDQSLAYLEYTREVPNYDPSVTLSAGTVTTTYSEWSGPFAFAGQPYDGSWDGGPAVMTVSVGTAGASPWLGMMPNWQTYWLYTGAWQMRQQSLQNADLSAAYPTQERETDATRILVRGGSAGSGLGLPVSVAGRPGIQNNAGGMNTSTLCSISGVFYMRGFCFGGASSSYLPVIPGSAAINHGDPWVSIPGDHEPQTWFIPYVETGDPWYLNEADLWASYLASTELPGNQAGGRGPTGAYCNFVDEFRGEAWFGLALASAAFMAPDSDSFKPYLQDCENDTLAMWEGALGITGTVYDGTTAKTWATPLLDPESSSGLAGSSLAARSIPTLHQWQNFFDAIVIYNTFEKPGMFIPTNTLGIFDPWMYHYNTLALGRATELGFASGALQSYLGTLYSNWVNTSIYSPYMFTQYGGVVEQTIAAGGGFYPSVSAVINEYTTPWLTGVGWNMSISSMTWSSTAGGQAAIATVQPNAVDPAGGQVTISGATNTGTSGNAAVNGTFNVVGWTDNQHFTVAMPNAKLATTGGTNSSVHLTNIASTSGVAVGSGVTGAGIPPQNTLIPANTNSSIHLTGISPSLTPDIAVGTQVFGPGIPAGDTVATLVSSTAVDLVSPATATATAVTLDFVNNVTVTNIVSSTAVDISVPATTTTASEALTFTNAVSGDIGTIAGSPTAVVVNALGGSAAQIWAANLSTAGDGGRMVWASPGNAMMTDEGLGSPWGSWWGVNTHNQIPNWSNDTHWDIVPRTDANVQPAQPTTTP